MCKKGNANQSLSSASSATSVVASTCMKCLAPKLVQQWLPPYNGVHLKLWRSERDCKWCQLGSADLHGVGSCWLLGHWAAVSAVMRSICLCFLPAATLTASVDCCCPPPPRHTNPPRPKVPDTQELNKITQISHVDQGKHFQLPSWGQLQLHNVTCLSREQSSFASLHIKSEGSV